MATVSIKFSPLPGHVRTARMLAVAVARRSGLPDELLDEVRLAVGEVCSRAIGVHARLGSGELVVLTATEDERGYSITVTDDGDPADAVPADLGSIADAMHLTDTDEDLPAGLELAVVAGLVDELNVGAVPAGGTVVTMRWKR